MNVFDVVILAQQGDSIGGLIGGGLGMIVYFAVIILLLAGLWMIFEKMGEAGWKSIVPIYNYIVLLELIGRPTWWVLLLMFVPVANIVVLFLIFKDVAEGFGKGTGFAVGMLLRGIL